MNETVRTAVCVDELDPATKSCGLTGIFHDRRKVTAPFDIEIDLTAINRRPGAAPEPEQD